MTFDIYILGRISLVSWTALDPASRFVFSVGEPQLDCAARRKLLHLGDVMFGLGLADPAASC